MFDIDFLAGSDSDPESTSSYDAITIRFKGENDTKQTVIVIDGGFSEIGNDVVNHLADYYNTDEVDLMISTHPDRDHLNGLVTAIQQLKVKELLIHQPDKYKEDLSEFTNLTNLNTLLAFAEEQGTIISDPFTGLSRFSDQILILGPTQEYYLQLLDEQLDPAVRASFARSGQSTRLVRAVADLFERALTHLPFETLGDGGTTHPRNNSSIITLLNFEDEKYLFTGDAGIPALEMAADEYEAKVGALSQYPLSFFQPPHHGSKRNVGKSILNRILGEPSSPHSDNWTAIISSAKASTKHPSPKVTNAILRRGCSNLRLAVTNGITKWHHSIDAPARNNWSNIDPYPILPEDEEDD